MLSVTRMIGREIGHAKLNFALSAGAVVVAVALCITIAQMTEASRRETFRIARDMGHNVRIIPRNADEFAFFERGYSDETMPESFVDRLAAHRNIDFNHLLPTLQQRVEVQGVSFVLVGLGQSIVTSTDAKKPMYFQLPSGKLEVGHQVARRLQLERGDTLQIGPVEFTIDRVSPEKGTEADIRVQGRLDDVQRALGMENRINEIAALDCRCLTDDANPGAILRAELEKLLPEAKMFLESSKADARARQRQLIVRYAGFTTPVILLASGAMIFVLAMLNVRQRTVEIGLLRALGYGSARIAALVLGRAVAVGLIGAVLGYAIGAAASLAIAPQMFDKTGQSLTAAPWLLAAALLAAPIFTAIATITPAMLAVTQDPAVTLRAD